MVAFGAGRRNPDGLAVLTHRQREVLALMAQGLSNAAIARRLFVTEKAVVQHCSNIYAALDLAPTPDEHRRVLAALRYVVCQQDRHTGAALGGRAMITHAERPPRGALAGTVRRWRTEERMLS